MNTTENLTIGQKITRTFQGETYTGTIAMITSLDSVRVIWDDEPEVGQVAMRLSEIEIVEADNTEADVEEFIESINDKPADYNIETVTTELNHYGIDLTQFDPQAADDGVYYQTNEQQVWAILARNTR